MSDEPHLRTDPISGRRVIIAAARSNRPNAFSNKPKTAANPKTKSAAASAAQPPCPFCPGNEDLTPDAILNLQSDGTATWNIRVIPNLYPATCTPGREAILDTPASTVPLQTAGHKSQPNPGLHEVVVESNRHIQNFTDLTPDEAEQVFLTYAKRFRAWQTENQYQAHNIRFAIAFKNNGRRAGMSIEHVHSQLVGLETIPIIFEDEWNRATTHFNQYGTCLFCSLLEKDLSEQERIVFADDEFVVLCPFASRLPFEMMILPRRHASHFDRDSDEQIRAMGRVTHAMLTRLTQLIENVPYNFLIHTAPFDTNDGPVYHWHVEVIPRIAEPAGFEWGTGIHVNAVSPEQAASQLRSV